MEQELTFRIILEDPPPGVDYGLQKGSGNDYEVVQKQRSKSGDLKFEFSARVKEGKDGQPGLLGSFSQGPAQLRLCLRRRERRPSRLRPRRSMTPHSEPWGRPTW